MVDTILQFLTWAIPSGGTGAAIAWIANRKVKRAEQAKQVHDTYKAMYEDVSRLLEQNQEKYGELTQTMDSLRAEHDRTRRALNRLSRAIEAIKLCPHRAACPVNGELSLDEEGSGGTDTDNSLEPRPAKRQRKKPAAADEEPGEGHEEPDKGHDRVADVGADDDGGRRHRARGAQSEDTQDSK